MVHDGAVALQVLPGMFGGARVWAVDCPILDGDCPVIEAGVHRRNLPLATPTIVSTDHC
jgi:hypothetical protein